jgi:hypothetical protein
MDTKVCAKCQQEKSKDQFYKHPNTADKVGAYCKFCQSDQSNGKPQGLRKLVLIRPVEVEHSQYFRHQKIATI